MKLLLLILLAVTASAQVMIPPGALVSSKRAVSGAASPTYLIKQGFEGAGYDNSETWSESGTGTVDEDYTGVVLDGSQSLNLSGTTQQPSSTASFSAQSDVYAYFLFHPVSIPAASVRLFGLRDGSSTLVTTVFIDSAGKLTVRASSSGGTSAATTTAMTGGVTYHVWVRYTKGTGANAFASVAFSTDGVKPTSGNNFTSHATGSATTDATQIRLGTEVNSTLNFIYDKTRVDEVNIGDNPE